MASTAYKHVTHQLNFTKPHINHLTHTCYAICSKMIFFLLFPFCILPVMQSAHPSMHTHACAIWHRDLLPILCKYGDQSPCSSSMGTFSPSLSWRGPREMLGHHMTKTSIISAWCICMNSQINTTCICNNSSYEYPIHTTKAHKHRNSQPSNIHEHYQACHYLNHEHTSTHNIYHTVSFNNVYYNRHYTCLNREGMRDVQKVLPPGSIHHLNNSYNAR